MVHTAIAGMESIEGRLHAEALGVLEGYRDALKPAFEVQLAGVTDAIGRLIESVLKVEGEHTEEGIGFGAKAASVFNGEGMVVGRLDELGLEHGGVSLTFQQFDSAGRIAGVEMGKMTPGRSRGDSGTGGCKYHLSYTRGPLINVGRI